MFFIFIFLIAGSFRNEESSVHSECPASRERLCVQPDEAGPGSRDASSTVEHRHSASTGSHEDFPQPPAGSFMLGCFCSFPINS